MLPIGMAERGQAMPASDETYAISNTRSIVGKSGRNVARQASSPPIFATVPIQLLIKFNDSIMWVESVPPHLVF